MGREPGCLDVILSFQGTQYKFRFRVRSMQLPHRGLMLQTRFLFSSGHPPGKLCIWNSNNISAKRISHYMQWEKANERKAPRNDWVTFLFAGLTSLPVAAVFGGCQETPGVDWKCQTPGKKSFGREKCECARSRFEESVWPQADNVGNRKHEIGKNSACGIKFSQGRRFLEL